MANQTIGDVISKFRDAIGVTQQELAVLMGSSVSSISNYEQGSRHPNAKALSTLCDIAHEHGQHEFSRVFDLHALVARGDTHPEFRFLFPGLAGLRQTIGRALADDMSSDPELFQALLKAALPVIERWQRERESLDASRAEMLEDTERLLGLVGKKPKS